jgi:hypothetical protein
MRLEGKKKGIRTSSTIRNNAFDRQYHNFDAYLEVKTINENKKTKYSDGAGTMRISLDKNKNWEKVDDLNLPTIKYHQISGDKGSYKVTALTNKQPNNYSGGAPYAIEYKGREVEYKTGEDGDAVIHLPFDKAEYPLYREYHKIHDGPCICCFQNNGKIWQLKGTGKKSKGKTKGMRRINKYNNDFAVN